MDGHLNKCRLGLCGEAIYPGCARKAPFPKPPPELAERYYNVTSWAEHHLGGHFPAVAEPELLAQSLRDAFRPMR